MADGRSVAVVVKRASGSWHGRLSLNGIGIVDLRNESRASLLADLFDALLANDVSVDPCCIDG